MEIKKEKNKETRGELGLFGGLEVIFVAHSFASPFDFFGSAACSLTGSTMITHAWPSDLGLETHGAWRLAVHGRHY